MRRFIPTLAVLLTVGVLAAQESGTPQRTVCSQATAANLNATVVGNVTSAPALSAAALPVRSVESQRTASGSLNALNATVVISGEGATSIIIEIDAGLVGSTVAFIASQDGSNWFSINAVEPTGAMSNGTVSFPYRGGFVLTGFAQYGVVVTVYGSGSSAARLAASAAGGVSTVTASQATAANLNATVTDGTGPMTVDGTVTANAGTGTFTVGGTVTCDAGTNLNTSALLTTAAHDAAFGTAGAADAQVRTIQGIASMTPVQVSQATAASLNATVTDGSGPLTVDGTVTANQGGSPWGVAINQTTTNNDVDVVTVPANQSVNVNQVAGSAVSTAGTGIQKVGVVGNAGAAFDAASGAAPPANRLAVGGLASGATGGFMLSPTVCDTFVNINVSTATTTLLITGVSGRHVRICAMNIVGTAAQTVALISGTGATCGTGTTGMNGGTTAATGWSFAANGGLTQGTGFGEINRTNATGDSVCIVTGAATQTSGRISYTIY